MMRKKYKLRSYLFHTLSILAIIIGLGSWILFRYEEYFTNRGAETASGLIMTLFVMILLLKGAFKNIKKEFSTIILLLLFITITFLLESILHDLQWILIIGLVSYLVYIPLNSQAVRFGKRADIMEEEELREEVRSGRA